MGAGRVLETSHGGYYNSRMNYVTLAAASRCLATWSLFLLLALSVPVVFAIKTSLSFASFFKSFLTRSIYISVYLLPSIFDSMFFIFYIISYFFISLLISLSITLLSPSLYIYLHAEKAGLKDF